jgi:hypothetical protein
MADNKTEAAVRVTPDGQIIIDSQQLAKQVEAARAAQPAGIKTAANTNWVCPENLYCPPKAL